MKKRAAGAALLLGFCTIVAAEGVQPSVAVFYPGVSWQLRYDLDGVLEEYNHHKAGVSTYAVARSEASGILVSAQVSPSGGATTPQQCRDAERQHVQKNKAFAKAEIKTSDEGATDMEVLVPLGERVVSRHVHRFWLRDGACAKVHASKTPFAESDRPAFDRLLGSVRFEPAAATLERAFVIPGRGTLVMPLPATWGFRTGKPAAGGRDIELMHSESDAKVVVTLLAEARRALKGDATARGFVETLRDSARPNAVESEPQLVPLKGGAADGYYFLVTDRSLVDQPVRPNDWKFLRQGALLLDHSLLFFSLFSNTKDAPAIEAALRGVSEARLVAPQR